MTPVSRAARTRPSILLTRVPEAMTAPARPRLWRGAVGFWPLSAASVAPPGPTSTSSTSTPSSYRASSERSPGVGAGGSVVIGERVFRGWEGSGVAGEPLPCDPRDAPFVRERQVAVGVAQG